MLTVGEPEIYAEYNHMMAEVEGLPSRAPDDIDDLFALRDNLQIVGARLSYLWNLMAEERPGVMNAGS